MPGAIAHLIVQQQLPFYLKEAKNGKKYADILLKDPCSPYASFGSMGPDFLFFSLKEYGTPLDELANFIFGVYDMLEPFIDFYEKTIGPIKQELEDAIAAVDAVAFQGLISQIQQTAELMQKTVETAAEVIVIKNIDLFYPFYPKLQDGDYDSEKDWYWCDYLHYRRTGRFCSTMWDLAQGDNELMCYSLGYASHIGTDVAGHPFVNAIVGGPYRMHWHRHKLVENWIDAYLRNHFNDSKHTISCLKLDSHDTYVPNAISGSYYYRLCEFNKGKLPKKLGALILDAETKTYSDIDHPVDFTFKDLDTTYRLWLKWFKVSTTIGSAIRPVPVPPPGTAFVNLITDYYSHMPSYSSGGSSGGSGGGKSVLKFFAALWKFIKWLWDTLWYTFEWIITHTWDIITLPYTEAIAALKWLLYQIQEKLYVIYDNLRFMMVQGGYLYPEPGDLSNGQFGKAFVNTNYVHLSGGIPAKFSPYPKKQETHGPFGPMEHHLSYPGTLQEYEDAEPAPLPFYGKFPEEFLSKTHPYDPGIEKLYACEGPYGNDDRFTHFIDYNTWITPQFGNALQLTTNLIVNYIGNLPNFNLDADRGYGWKTWKGKAKILEKVNPVEVYYIDYKG